MQCAPTPRHQQGVMLLEALLAILIFSLGILALVGMQANAISSVADAKYRADASFLANQIIAQIWVDRANIAQYSHHAGTATCDAGGAASAYANVGNWLANIQTALPGASADRQQISIGADNHVTVTICWLPPKATSYHNFVQIAQILDP